MSWIRRITLARAAARAANPPYKEAPSIVVVIAGTPDARALGARLLLGGFQFGASVCRRPSAAIVQHDPREVLITNSAPIDVAGTSRLAHHLSSSEIAPEITHGVAPNALDSEETNHLPIQLEHAGGLDVRYPANGSTARFRLGLGARARRCYGGSRRRSRRLRPRRHGLRDELAENARRYVPPGDGPGGAFPFIPDGKVVEEKERDLVSRHGNDSKTESTLVTF